MNIQEKFVLYIEGLLSGSEIKQIEEQLNNDPELYREFIRYREAHHLLEKNLSSQLLSSYNDPLLQELSLKEKLEIDEDVDDYLLNPLHEGEEQFHDLLGSVIKKKRKSIIAYSPFFRAAASITILLLVSAGLFLVNNFYRKQSGSELFRKYYNPLEDKSFKSYDAYNVVMQKFMTDFRNSDFEAASTNLDGISNIYDTEYLYHILKGLILIEKGEPEPAKAYLRIAVEKAPAKNRNIARWYLSLILINENDIKDAIPLLSVLSNEKNPYRNNAKKILRRVKQE